MIEQARILEKKHSDLQIKHMEVIFRDRNWAWTSPDTAPLLAETIGSAKTA